MTTTAPVPATYLALQGSPPSRYCGEGHIIGRRRRIRNVGLVPAAPE
jgi:hypothetical protein